MNLKHPVGETVTWWGKPLKVIGIVKNMVIESPYDEARPTIYTNLIVSRKCHDPEIKPGGQCDRRVTEDRTRI